MFTAETENLTELEMQQKDRSNTSNEKLFEQEAILQMSNKVKLYNLRMASWMEIICTVLFVYGMKFGISSILFQKIFERYSE